MLSLGHKLCNNFKDLYTVFGDMGTMNNLGFKFRTLKN